MPWLILVAGLAVVLAYAEKKRATTTSAALPVTLPTSSGAGSSGESAQQQEITSAESTASAVATAASTGNVAGVVTAGLSGLLTQLTQHSQRLADAKAENVAMQPAVGAYDEDLAAIAAAYSAGTITAAQAAACIATLDGNIQNNLHTLVGKPGTAWSGPYPVSLTTAVPESSVTCNNKCTVSCCVYFNDLRSPLIAAYTFLLGGSLSAVPAGDQPFLTSAQGGEVVAGGFVLGVPEVYPPDDPSYGDFSRAAYTVSFVRGTTSTPLTQLASVI